MNEKKVLSPVNDRGNPEGFFSIHEEKPDDYRRVKLNFRDPLNKYLQTNCIDKGVIYNFALLRDLGNTLHVVPTPSK